MDSTDSPPPSVKEERDECNNCVPAADGLSTPKGSGGSVDEALSPLGAAPVRENAGAATNEERWWCDDCSAAASESCREKHPGQVLTTDAARATLLARLTPAVKAAKAANKRLSNLQDAMDTLEESLADRGPRLLVAFDGWYDEWECGILDGNAPVGLLTTEAALSAQGYAEKFCSALTNLELTLDLEKEELSGWCSLPRELLDSCFPLRPPGLDLRPGAILCDYEQITIFMTRCPAKTGAGKRLLGYVEKAGLRALTADRGPCVGLCAKACVLCDDEIVIVLRRVHFDDKRAKRHDLADTDAAHLESDGL